MANDERVQAFLNRPLKGDWPFLWLQATYVKLRDGGRIVSRSMIVAVAVNTDGRRDILGITVIPSEAETFWSGVLRSLTRRGLRRVQRVIKRRINVVAIFLNRDAVIRLVGALMLEQNDEWAVSRRYMPLEKLTAICKDDPETAKTAAQ